MHTLSPSVPALILVHVKDEKGGGRARESSGISVHLTTDENDAFQLRCWLDLSHVPHRVRQGARGWGGGWGGLLTKVGLLSSLTALSMKFTLRRCFFLSLYKFRIIHTKPLVCLLIITILL